MALRDPFVKANYLLRKADYMRWHRQQSKQQILRSQVGFVETGSSRPVACLGCDNYHGIAYGYSRDTRTVLICALHPSGWLTDEHCPDWQGAI